MSLESVIADNTAALRDLIAALASGTPVTKAQVADVVTEAKADKPAPKAKTEKVKEDPKPEAAEEAAEEPAATPEPKDEDAAAEAKAEITAADITAVVIALGKAGKRPELIELLGKYEVAKGSELHKNDLAGFHKRATAILEG